MQLPQVITTDLEGAVTMVHVCKPTTAGELERAESAVTVMQQGRRLPAWCQLHEGERYVLQVWAKRQARSTSQSITALSSSSLIIGVGPFTGDGASCPIGLGDTHVWKGMKSPLDFYSPSGLDLPWAIYPFRATQLLGLDLPIGFLRNWQLPYKHSNGMIMPIFEYDNEHWISMTGELCGVMY